VTDLADALWQRAKEALLVARRDFGLSPDAAASRAYYAALYAVSAHFALRGRHFSRHSAVEQAVHRDLVKTGDWARELGARYSLLVELRSVSDYGEQSHVSTVEAQEAIQTAADVLAAVRQHNPGRFPPTEES
jgi:uncharacterized protein (UPF0332 family)